MDHLLNLRIARKKSKHDSMGGCLVPTGLSNCAKQNHNYNTLITNLNLIDLSNSRIAEIWGLREVIRGRVQWDIPPEEDRVYKSGLSREEELEIIFKVVRFKWSLRSVATLYNTNISTIRFVCSKFKRREGRLRKLAIIRETPSKRFISDKHIEAVRCYMESNPDKISTISNIKSSIERRADLPSLSKTSIRKILKKHLKYTYKKACKINPRTLLPVNIRKIHESLYIQVALEKKNYEIIYLDEFSLSTRKYVPYNWAPRGKQAYSRPCSQDFTMSFIIAFSRIRFYGIMGTMNTGNSKMFLRFIKNLTKYQSCWTNDDKDRWCIVLDNSTIHTCNEIQEELCELQVRLITIWPYSPFLNPAEKLICWVKEKVNSMMAENR